MTILAAIFFATVFAASVWAVVATVAPRLDYLIELMSGQPASRPVPVAERRRVRRLNPLPLRSELRAIRAAA